MLDLFAGSAALGLESISRGAKEAVFVDNSKKAIEIIKKNIEKLSFQNQSNVIKDTYENALALLSKQNRKFNIVFLDPPYLSEYGIRALEIIKKYQLLEEDGIVIFETDRKEQMIEKIEDLKFNIFDIRKYGKVSLIFLN